MDEDSQLSLPDIDMSLRPDVAGFSTNRPRESLGELRKIMQASLTYSKRPAQVFDDESLTLECDVSQTQNSFVSSELVHFGTDHFNLFELSSHENRKPVKVSDGFRGSVCRFLQSNSDLHVDDLISLEDASLSLADLVWILRVFGADFSPMEDLDSVCGAPGAILSPFHTNFGYRLSQLLDLIPEFKLRFFSSDDELECMVVLLCVLSADKLLLNEPDVLLTLSKLLDFILSQFIDRLWSSVEISISRRLCQVALDHAFSEFLNSATMRAQSLRLRFTVDYLQICLNRLVEARSSQESGSVTEQAAVAPVTLPPVAEIRATDFTVVPPVLARSADYRQTFTCIQLVNHAAVTLVFLRRFRKDEIGKLSSSLLSMFAHCSDAGANDPSLSKLITYVRDVSSVLLDF